IAANTSATLRQSLLLHEIKAALNRPQRPVIGMPIPPEETRAWARDPRGYLAWLRASTLSLEP
ncbi:MAG: acyltransferase, partial [Gemmobacter sp.]